MSLKSLLVKSTISVATLLLFTTTANAKWQYNVGIGYGIGLFEFNGKRDDSTFQGNVANPVNIATGNPSMPFLPSSNPAFGGGNVAMRTTYKYVGNQPQRLLHLEAGITKKFEDIRFMDRNFFAGGILGFSYGKAHASEGLTNPNAKYMNTGSTSLYWSLSGKFGLENAFSKLYGIAGLTYAKTDLPFDILPFGTNTKLGDLDTCTVFRPGSTLLQSVGNSTLNGIPITNIAQAVQTACSQINVKDASYGAWFINLGAGTEVNITQKMTIFAEYYHLFQLNKGKTQTVDYTANGVAGQFKGVIRTTNVDYIKAGVRYYFN